MTTRRIATTVEPVTVAEVKALIPLTGSDFDARIGVLISALRMQVEQMTQRALARSTWVLKLDAFPGTFVPIGALSPSSGPLKREPFPANAIALLWPPLVSIESVTYLDTTNAVQTVNSADYTVDIHSEPGRIVPVATKAWPDTYQAPNAVSVAYTAGYGASSPELIKLWIAARVRADIDGVMDAAGLGLLDGLLDVLKVYAG